MEADEKLVTILTTQNLRGLVSAGTTRPLSEQATAIDDHGVAPGRKVLDTVTGLPVEVISSSIVHIPVASIPEVSNG